MNSLLICLDLDPSRITRSKLKFSSMNISLKNCYDLSNFSQNSSPVLDVKETLAVPSILVLGAAVVLAGIIMFALVLSKCYKFPNSLLYFNISLTDAIMAAAGIAMFLVPTNEATGSKYHKIAIIFTGLR